MKPTVIDHIGIAVSDLDEALKFWEGNMGVKCHGIEEVAEQKVKTAFLPVKDTETDMTANADGSYTADKAGQYLLQTIDADALLTKYGSETKITGLEFCGNPASCTGSELEKIVGIQKAKDGTVTEWGSTTLSMTPAVVRLANTTALTLEELGNRQIGVKAGV